MMEDEIELSLELSIGGCYAKSDSKKEKEGKTRDLCEKIVNGDDKIDDHGFVSRSDFSNVGAENRCEFVDLQRRKEIQALRRREARMKREVKKSRGINNGGGFVEEKLVLDAQQFQSRVQDRESREKDVISEEFALKREENGRKRVVEDLNVSLLSENKNLRTDFAMQTQFVYPQMQYLPIANGFAYPWVVPLWGPNVVEGERNKKNAFQFRLMANGNGNGSRNSSIDCDSGNDREVILRRSVEQSFSAVSDCGSASRKVSGVSSSDTRSHSSSLGTNRNQCVSESEKIEHVEGKDSPSQLEPGQCIGVLNPEHSMKVVSLSPQQLTSSTSKITERSKSRTQSNQTCSTTEKPSSPLSKETSGVINKPPKPPNHNQSVASLQHMPCVSTTGNGPNGKTITGFLYKYTKYEVSIMCVCHGRSFSPAEFVQHAGGVDVLHPLKHITIVPSAMG